MSLGIAGDLILDVAKAADPTRARAAVARLEESGASSFAALVEPKSLHSAAKAADTAFSGKILSRSDFEKPAGTTGKSVGAAFETMMLQSLLQNMMPQPSTAVFGKGTAGSAYKMFMAEQFAKQMTNAGAVGIGALVDRSVAAKSEAHQVMPAILGKSVDV